MSRRAPFQGEVVIGTEELDLRAWVRRYLRAILGLHGITAPPEPQSTEKESAV